MNYIFDTEKMKKIDKFFLYRSMDMDYFNDMAVFSDDTESFRSPSEPSKGDNVEIKLRTEKKNVDKVFLVCGGKNIEMQVKYSENIFDYYAVNITIEDNATEYYFMLYKNDNIFIYNKKGIVDEANSNYNFKIVADFKVPQWAKGAVMYQIFVDRFYDGDPTNNVINEEYIYLSKVSKHIDDWNKTPSEDDVRNFYGGDIKGIMDKLDYLSDLGIEVIYLNPIFVSPSNHKYDIQDYDYIDPHIGVIPNDGGELLGAGRYHNKFATRYMKRTTDKVNLEASNQLVAQFIKQAHDRNIKVILDGVFNHCGAFNKWLDREGFYSKDPSYPAGAYRQKDSPYNSFFLWYDTENWPNNDCYDGWWGFDNHPKLNYEGSQELYKYILNIGAKWVSEPFNADGWRLDVAADLGRSSDFNHQFWRDFRTNVKRANPEAIILAEHYGDASSWLNGDQWDSIMNYDAFMEPITWFLTGMEKHSDEFRADMLCNAKAFEESMKDNMAKLNIQSIQSAMNELSNHDHSRFLTRTNMTVGRLKTKGAGEASKNINKGIMKEAVTFQMTWPGSPTIYYADEAGTVGWTDPDNRRTYPWGKEDMELWGFHKAAIALHRSYQALKTGSLEYLVCETGILVYGRWDEKARLIIALNNNSASVKVKIPVWRIGIVYDTVVKRILFSQEEGFETQEKDYSVFGGNLEVELAKYSSSVFILSEDRTSK